MNQIREFLKKIPGLVLLKRLIWQRLNKLNNFQPHCKTKLNLVKAFPLYQPCSAGSYKSKAQLTIQTINQVFPLLSIFVKTINGNLLHIQNIVDFPQTEIEKSSAELLKVSLDLYGSDKANLHNYHYLYGSILSNKNDVKNIFEIGLGTNNTDVVSNMGVSGKPGASCRAFRDYCPNASIFGADIDKRILFSSDRITTYYLDQTEPSTFADILPKVPKDFDLVIDDGLHSPNANIESLRFGLEIVKKGGWVVVEDIAAEAIPFWQVVAALLASKCRCHILNAEGAIVFAVQRLDADL